MITKNRIFIVTAVCCCLFSMAWLSPLLAAEKGTAKKDAATVNGVAITTADLDREVGRYEQQMTMMGQTVNPEQLKEIKVKILDGLIDRELLYQESKKEGIKADKAEVDQQMNALKQRFPKAEDLKQSLEQMGLTEAGLRTQFEQELAIKALIDKKFAGKVTVTEQEMKKFYNENPDYFKTQERVRASHILVKVDAGASDADKKKARQKIEDVQKKVKKGEDFAALAKQFSDCPSSTKGGDLDYFQRGQMVKPFEDVAFAMKVGDVSDIVETQFGYHLIKLTDKQAAGKVSFDEAKDKIKSYLEQQKMGEEVKQYVTQLKQKSKVEKFLN